MKRIVLLFAAVVIFFFAVFSEAEDFVKIYGPSFTVYYEQSVNLDKLYRKISRRRLYFYKSTRPDPASTLDEKISFRVNLILERVKEILGMYPVSINFKIKIFKDQISVTDAYRGITGRHDKVKAFYVHKLNTIFTSEEGVSDSVLAHEMGHLLQNYYFLVPPSSKVSELLSVYVDSNLEG